MTSTVGDYLFWRLASSGATRVIGHNQNSMFLGSIQRNNLQYLNPNHHTIIPYVGEIGVFVASTQAGDIYACYQEMRQWFPQSPVVFVMELDSAQFTSVSQVAPGYHFASSTIIHSPVTAVSQINRVLDTMLYESKAVFLGLSLAVAGQIITVPSTSIRSSGGQANNGAQYEGDDAENSAKAAIAMGFM